MSAGRRDGHVDDGAGPILGHVQRFDDLAVGHGVHLTVAGAQLGDAQRDILDGADGGAAVP